MIPAFFSSARVILLECRESPAIHILHAIWYLTPYSYQYYVPGKWCYTGPTLVYTIDSCNMIGGKFRATVLNVNRLFLNLNRFICNCLPVLPNHRCRLWNEFLGFHLSSLVSCAHPSCLASGGLVDVGDPQIQYMIQVRWGESGMFRMRTCGRSVGLKWADVGNPHVGEEGGVWLVS